MRKRQPGNLLRAQGAGVLRFWPNTLRGRLIAWYPALLTATLAALGGTTLVLLARGLVRNPELLLLDEPTNHLDIEAVEWLERTLREWEGAVLIVSHDRYFLDNVVNTIWEMDRSGIEVYAGNYSAYLLQREARLPAFPQHALGHPQQVDVVDDVLAPPLVLATLFYLPAVFYGPHTNFAVIDNWRFWIIHLWVEGFFELFATVLVATMFQQMGLVSVTTATRVVYLDAILYLGAGIVGTGHHWYFTGQGTLNMGLASAFSAMEVVPLTLLTLDAWDFVRLKNRPCADCGASFAGGQMWAIYFLMAVGFWNFVGAGVFGFLINMPIVSYYEVGTMLTANHGHAALMGVFGMLGLALLTFALRQVLKDEQWARIEKHIRHGFWGLNIGLLLMVLISLLPGGILQMVDALNNGYWHARSPEFLATGVMKFIEWIRIVPDVIFLVAGVLPILFAALQTYLMLTRRPREQLAA